MVTKLRKNATKSHFQENCDGGPKNKNFWQTIKPFITNKGYAQDEIAILDDDKIITDKLQLCNMFNNYYVNIVADIGTDTTIGSQTPTDIMEKYKNRASIESIKTNIGEVPSWNLACTDVSTVTKLLQNLNKRSLLGGMTCPLDF